MAANIRGLGRSGLARALVQHGRLRDNEVDALIAEASSAGASFIEQLVASRRMTALEVAEFAAATFGMPLLDLAAADAARLLGPREARAVAALLEQVLSFRDTAVQTALLLPVTFD